MLEANPVILRGQHPRLLRLEERRAEVGIRGSAEARTDRVGCEVAAAASASCRAGGDKVWTRETTSSSRLRGTGKGCVGFRSPCGASARAISSA